VKTPSAFGRRLKAAKKLEEVEADEEVEEEVVDEEQEVEDADEVQEEEEEESEVDRVTREEEETTVSRKKELKAMYLDDLKAVATKAGLELCKKELMLDAILTHEATGRSVLRAQKAQVRQVLVSKKEELEAMGLPELKQECSSLGMTGTFTKQVRIEMIIKQWQEEDGVDVALAKMAHDQREGALAAMEKSTLIGLCEAAGIDPFVKELIVERIVRVENKSGNFARPSSEMKQLPDEDAEKAPKKADMVDALLANEENRKKEKELRRQQDELAESKKRELRVLTMDELKKQLTKHKLDASGKKEELVEALYLVKAQEDTAAARKVDLKALGTDKLKALMELNGIDSGKGTKATEMVELFLAREEKVRETARAYEVKVADSFLKQKEILETKSTVELKELCASKNLKPGVGKEAHVERLIEELKENGLPDTEKLIATQARSARYASMMAMDQSNLLQLADDMEINTLVKEVMVERVMAHEDEFGPVVVDSSRAKKKARKA